MKLGIPFVSLLLAATLAGCQHNSDIPTPIDDSDSNPVANSSETITPVGAATGPVATATIGPGGGTLESADKRIRIQIPTGALSTSQTVSVQALDKSYCPGSTGTAFRLLPHGLAFAKPVTISWQYTEADIHGSAPEFLRVAYQTTKGDWHTSVTSGLDTTTRGLTVQTTHFSDWSLFQTIHLDPAQAIVVPGGSVELGVWYHLPPTAPGDVVVPVPTRVEAKYVSRWTLVGQGDLTHASMNQATYTAPRQLPARNPAIVNVDLNVPVAIGEKTYASPRLTSNIYIVGESAGSGSIPTSGEGIWVSVDNGAWRAFAGGVSLNSTQNVIEGKNGSDYVALGWTGGPLGTFRWTTDAQVIFSLTTGKRLYQHRYGTAPSLSGGAIQLVGRDETYLYGTFTVQPAGWVDTTQPTNPTRGTSDIQGVFRVRRIN